MYTRLRAPSAAIHARPPRRAHHPRLRTRTQPPVDTVLLHVIHEEPSDNCEICARLTRAEGVKEACGVVRRPRWRAASGWARRNVRTSSPVNGSEASGGNEVRDDLVSSS